MILVDTSAWVAVADGQDGSHKAALTFHRELLRGTHGRLLTTDFVMDETLTLVRKRCGPDLVRSFAHGLDSSKSTQQLWVNTAQFVAARSLFLTQGAHAWSLTDCTSFVVMRELGIQVAFAFDRDFEQAGFRIYPS
jgi:uncharacterized protein